MSDLSRTFAALGDPTRLHLVEHLLQAGEQPAGELTQVTDISAPAVSRHLKVLREAGILTQRVDGQRRLYSVAPAKMDEIEAWLRDRRAFWQTGLDRLGALIRDQQDL